MKLTKVGVALSVVLALCVAPVSVHGLEACTAEEAATVATVLSERLIQTTCTEMTFDSSGTADLSETTFCEDTKCVKAIKKVRKALPKCKYNGENARAPYTKMVKACTDSDSEDDEDEDSTAEATTAAASTTETPKTTTATPSPDEEDSTTSDEEGSLIQDTEGSTINDSVGKLIEESDSTESSAADESASSSPQSTSSTASTTSKSTTTAPSTVTSGSTAIMQMRGTALAAAALVAACVLK